MRTGARLINGAFGLLSMLVLLALVVTVPILGFYSLGYMLRSASRVATGGRVREAFRGLQVAGRLGQSVLAAWLWTLPARLLYSMHSDAVIIDPGGGVKLSYAASFALAGAAVMVALGLIQGGRLDHFVRPIRGVRTLTELLRDRGEQAREELRERGKNALVALEPKASWWLGCRAYLVCALWLVPPTALMAAQRKGLTLVIGGVLLAVAARWLLVIPVHVAVHDELVRGLRYRDARYMLKRAPLAYSSVLILTVALAAPLYLLKIELVPRDALWLPSLVFIATMFPAKLALGWAYGRAARRAEPAPLFSRVLGFGLGLGGLVAYVFAVYLSANLGWHGVMGMFEHHAFLLPAPF